MLEDQPAEEIRPAEVIQEPQIHGPEKQSLAPELLEAIGKRLDPSRTMASPILEDIAIRWADILRQGLPEEEKKELRRKYPIPENCITMEPPKLNPQIRATLLDPLISRDKKIVEKQQKVSVCLAALGPMLGDLLRGNTPNKLSLITTLSDVSRLLVDLQQDESQTRRLLIVSKLNNAMKDTLISSNLDEWLFGKDLEERLNAAKVMERSSKNLKPIVKNTPPSKGQKNLKGPLRSSHYYQMARGGVQRKPVIQGRTQNVDHKSLNYRRSTFTRDQSNSTRKI
ncbi:uncharacterized protein LOC143210388 [Lasioglossum baleicum]|uniref:uncharacterized protein LOC143210388 n=1 Tax=Lasioglossum baleicum TaxID=434251 RepID=UPI003FCC9824